MIDSKIIPSGTAQTLTMPAEEKTSLVEVPSWIDGRSRIEIPTRPSEAVHLGTPDTESLESVPTKQSNDSVDLNAFQREIYQLTRAASRPLAGLMPYLLDRRNIFSAWARVSSAEGADSPGPDGVTCSSIGSNVGRYLARLVEELYQKSYKPQPPRLIEVPKHNKPNETRQLGILNVRDRIVHTAIKQLLEPIFEPMFAPHSYGFRQGRSVAGALDAVSTVLSVNSENPQRFAFAVPLDVANCFPTIDHASLKLALRKTIDDGDLLHLLDQILLSGGQNVGRFWWQRLAGLVQGSSLSPLLCNLALHSVDEAILLLNQNTQGGVALFRYADDLLLLARDAKLAHTAIHVIKTTLAQRHQKLKKENSPIPVGHGFPWLGTEFRQRSLVLPGAIEFGYVVPRKKIDDMVTRLFEMTTPPSDKIDMAAFNLGKWIVSINNQLRDWRQVYLFADNAPEVFHFLDQVTRDRVAHLAKAVLGLSWSELRRNYLVQLPRGFWTWEFPGARLSVLSSLAPHAPAHLTRRPAWMKDKPALTSQRGNSCDV